MRNGDFNGRILTLPRSAGLQPALDVAWHLDSCEKADYKSALRYFAGGGVKLRPWRDLLTTLRHGKARFLNALFCFAHCRTRNKKAHGKVP